MIASHIQRLLLTSILDIFIKVLAPFNDVLGHMGASLLCCTNKGRSEFGNYGSLLIGNDAMMSWLRL
jgi:hypothetical protein